MSYPPAVPLSCVAHHLQTPQKLIQEKGRLAGPADPSVSQGIGCGENPTEANDHLWPLDNMPPTQPGASPNRYRPYIRLSEPPLHLKWCSHLPSGDHRICFPLPLDSISSITILPVAFPFRPSPCMMTPPIHTIICYIIIKQ